MNNEENNMNDLLKKAQEMINNNQVPEEIKMMMQNMNMNGNSNNNNNNSSNTQANNDLTDTNNSNINFNANPNSSNDNFSNNTNRNSNNSNNFSGNQSNGSNNININDMLKNFNPSSIDPNTMSKLQSMMNTFGSNNKNDDMSQLLLALKPYMRDTRKDKVDEYINLIKMGKAAQLFDLLGGGKK